MSRKKAGVIRPFAIVAMLLGGGVAMAAGAAREAPEQAAIANFGCSPEHLPTYLKDIEPGQRVRPDLIACVPFKSSHFGVSDPILSPDGERIAQWHNGTPAPLEIAAIRSGDYTQLPNRVSFRGFRSLSADHAIRWSDDSASIWTVRQDVMAPSGFALSGLAPIRVGLDGKPADLPALVHPAGPLDAVHWVDGKGVAIAQFGTRGGYYKPEHADDAPSFAIVDAARGKVRASLPVKSIPELADGLPASIFRVANPDVAAVMLKNGKVRAVLQFPAPKETPPLWLVWTEGAKPEIRKGVEKRDRGSRFALTPDGAGLLVNPALQPDGIQVSDCGRGGRSAEACAPPPTPVDGPIAELVDIRSGKAMWRINARAAAFWPQRGRPAISPDGRLALIELPPETQRRRFGLIDMKTGELLDRFSAWSIGSYPVTFDFTPDGRRIWLACGGMLVRFGLGQGGGAAPGSR
jgi:hypothetical protein